MLNPYIRSTHLCHHVTLACQNLHLEVPVSGINGVGLVDHAGNAGVLIYDYLTWNKTQTPGFTDKA